MAYGRRRELQISKTNLYYLVHVCFWSQGKNAAEQHHPLLGINGVNIPFMDFTMLVVFTL